MTDFVLDPTLARDSTPITTLGLCALRLINDNRWPWLLLVPKRPSITEVFELSPLDQTMLTFETCMAASALKKVTGAKKINIGALGNRVPQFHMHIIARDPGDDNWPGPVWGFGQAEPWDDDRRAQFIDRIMDTL